MSFATSRSFVAVNIGNERFRVSHYVELADTVPCTYTLVFDPSAATSFIFRPIFVNSPVLCSVSQSVPPSSPWPTSLPLSTLMVVPSIKGFPFQPWLGPYVLASSGCLAWLRLTCVSFMTMVISIWLDFSWFLSRQPSLATLRTV